MFLTQRAISRITRMFTPAASEPSASFFVRYPREAVTQDLSKFNKETGRLAGGAIALIVTDNGPKHIHAWISPHNYDPIAVKLYEDGSAEWRHTDRMHDEVGPLSYWRKDFEKNKLAPGVLAILQKHSESLFNGGLIARPPQVKGLDFDGGK